MPTSNAPGKILDQEFLGIRAKLIDLAASLDRMRRAVGPASEDPRMDKIRQAAEIIAGRSPNQAEQIQLLFSLPYGENWQSR